MDFLSPGTIAIAGAATIPPLVALYFLKLKRSVQPVASTLLWKKAIEDLHVNAPFQRLRSSLLLLLQLLILILAALALGKPMLQVADRHKETVILMMDQSASMSVIEAGGRTRLELAKEQAKLTVNNMDDGARAMIIAFCDRATVVASFDTDKVALKRKIDSIEQTDSRSTLGEAMSLAEAYTQNMIIGQETGPDLAIQAVSDEAAVFVFSDARIEDAEAISLQRFKVDRVRMIGIGSRRDNQGIVAMAARRNYERPEILQVTATIQNFSPESVSSDVVLYVDGENVDVITITLGAAYEPEATETEASNQPSEPAPAPPDIPRTDSTGVVAFDEVEFDGSGVIEVVLRVDDALSSDNRAWTIIPAPRRLQVLLVSEPNPYMASSLLENVLATLPGELLHMTPQEYEDAPDSLIQDGKRSAFDVVVFNGHSTARLPMGNYFFWGAIPELDGVSAGDKIDNQVIFNWDDTHALLRHVAVDGLVVGEWKALSLPPEAVPIIEGQTSPVLAYLTRDGSQHLISAFTLTTEDEFGYPRLNTNWTVNADFVVFMYNAVQYLGANLGATGLRDITPGSPVTMPIPGGTKQIIVHRPDGTQEEVGTEGQQTLHYARTRLTGIYHIEPAAEGEAQFAVNLFNDVEGRVEPASDFALGATVVETQAGSVQTNEPAWHYFLLALLFVLLLEWVVYNRRVFV